MADKGQTRIQQLAGNWSEQVAYYRFINNDNVSTSSLIAGLTQATSQRIEADHYLVLQDTTQVNLEKYRSRIEPESGLGLIADNRSLGFYLHSALVLNAATESCVGFSAIETFVHPPERPDKHARKYQTLPIQQKESYRWIETVQASAQVLSAARLRTYIQDREGDIFELLATRRTSSSSARATTARSSARGRSATSTPHWPNPPCGAPTVWTCAAICASSSSNARH